MPGFNRNGPNNEGPATGQRRGYCTKEETDIPYQKPDQEIIYGLGRGGIPCGCGHRRRQNRGFNQNMEKDSNLEKKSKEQD